MFYYISFLRPPPLQVSPSGSISITPQIANDLRTERFAESQEIFYSWSYKQPGEKTDSLPIITKPQKLTIWRESNAYKEIPVPLPPGVREGRLCRLILTAHARGDPHVVDLASLSLGERPFPVLSMPIHFSSRSYKGKPGAGSTGKQEQIERLYRIPLGGGDGQAFITVTEQTSFDLDKKIWDSGIGLSSWIVDLHSEGSALKSSFERVALLKGLLFSSAAGNIIELGAGTGIVSLTLGTLRSVVPLPTQGCVITTDLPSAMPLLEHNIRANESLFNSPFTRPQAVVLDWDIEDAPEEISCIDSGFDVIVMADVTYNTASFPSLIRTLVSLGSLPRSSSAATQRPMILLGYKERDPAERTLWDMARDVGITFEKVGEKPGAGGEPIEIWVGSW
ncbi:uncharacterized protein LAESUDRAFT_742889 [Laetiporus sulphureus 93-53]|uniref:Methyltransferase-domain-containing protein n=1 Tax=Laetiporus sulphureus 93-53 TaxID=1314785 RepID=A0A165ENA2_9APHY|nr:uncharacterized protein LAESUDRAFT_742889 [Laetiporus sulphureus 93-53]KZT07420.1 hypothetical protein LAESUDRAFT_742889 [Laetiporus sulphureus 93-53]